MKTFEQRDLLKTSSTDPSLGLLPMTAEDNAIWWNIAKTKFHAIVIYDSSGFFDFHVMQNCREFGTKKRVDAMLRFSQRREAMGG